ncbi:hypothetical protein BDZ89DRAFT_1066762 [Hymenopellis radicata]|nr:hypothetical protein BDZ89DRAFT_1066762 [Hymenopellis radicata]
MINFPPALSEFLPDIQQSSPTPRMLRLLTSNEAPSDTEMEQFQALITQSSSSARLLAEKISVTKDLLEFLVKQRKQAKSNRADAKLILHPMRRLPYDVLETIFTYTSGFDALGDSLNTKYAPWTLSHVCRQWRFTALSIANLWSTLDISLSKAPSRYRLQLCLERSKERPLDVCLTFRRSQLETQGSLLDVLYPSSPRWVELRLEVPIDCLRDMESRVYLPKLKKATIVQRPTEDVSAIIARSSLFSTSIHLKSLNAAVNFPFFRFTFYGQKITYFRSMHDRLLDHLYALQHMPNLREAVLHCHPSMRALSYPRTVTMKKLRTLQIFEAHDMATGATRAADLFDFLELPALKRLTLDLLASARFPQIRPAPTTLTNLTVVIASLPPTAAATDALVAFLQTVPNVKRFVLRCDTVPADLVRSLTANLSSSYESSRPAVTPLLPHLEEIFFQGLPAGLSHSTTVLLVALALSRRRNEAQGCANLQMMGLDARMVLCDNDLMLEAWKRLREDGLHVPCSHMHRGCN